MDASAPEQLISPPHEFTLMPFWFWNDTLEVGEILSQIADFEAHGVHGFVLHPRMGLPREIAWMSDTLLSFMRIAIQEAQRRGMLVILYDEGMYPSGSSSGQVVAADPALACRCLAMLNQSEALPQDANVVARVVRSDGQPITIIDRPAVSYIRGIHYRDESRVIEEEPAAADILNPRTAAMVIRLVYDRFFESFKEHFGKTIIGIFTDEPNPLGKSREPSVRPGTAGILQHVSDLLGYDFTPHLAALWDDAAESKRFRADYDWAIHRRLEQTWYRPLSEWCAAHGVALCGHPDRGDEIGVQRFFQIPGQDLVWRWVLPDHPSALEGPESTQAKCSASAMLHLGRRRNSNEFCGAYGHETTFDEFQWLANWCFVRGVNLLIPHAFYYSVRGPRRDERPPQVGGVGCSWWERFKPFADHCRRLSWLNADSRHICNVAILANADHCPWRAAKVLFEHQRDFNYVESALLQESAEVAKDGIRIAGMHYRLLIIDGNQSLTAELERKIAPMRSNSSIISFSELASGNGVDSTVELMNAINLISATDLEINPPTRCLRIRHVVKDDRHYYLIFNEGHDYVSGLLTVATTGKFAWIETSTGTAEVAAIPLELNLPGWSCCLLQVEQ